MEKTMTKQSGIYKWTVCGNIVEVVHTGAGDLVCCGQPMQLLTENTTDASREKHVPVIEKIPDGVKVKVGSAPHPMEEKHYIESNQHSRMETDNVQRGATGKERIHLHS
jgi:superoxide reductase